MVHLPYSRTKLNLPSKSSLSSVGLIGIARPSPGRLVCVIVVITSDHRDEKSPVFIYSCPSASSVKHRMLYSSGSGFVYRAALGLLSSIDGASPLSTRRVETSDPKEINTTFLTDQLASSASSSWSSIPTRAGLRGADNGGA